MSKPSGPRVLVVLACLLALAGCSSLGGTEGKGYVTGEGVPIEVEPAERGKVIELSGQDLEGDTLEIADLRGKPVVINVWGSWCPPCRVEQPDLNGAADELGERAAFVGINIRDASVDPALAYVREHDVEYPSFYSPDGKALLPFVGTIPPNRIPSTLVLDAEGRVAAAVIGRIPSELTLVSLVEKILDEPGAA